MNHPASTKVVLFRVEGESLFRCGFFLKDANRFVRNVNRWKDTEQNEWFDDNKVKEWHEL